MTRVRLLALATALALVTALSSTARAQERIELGGAVDVGTLRAIRSVTQTRTFSGPVLGVQGHLGYKRFALDATYSQANLTPSAETVGVDEELADATLMLRVMVKPWLRLGLGPHLRAAITPSGSSHWSRFEGRATVTGELIPGLADAYFEGWYALSATSNAQGGGSGAMGAAGGLAVRIPRSPVSLRLTYSADRATFTAGGDEVVEQASLAIVLGRY